MKKEPRRIDYPDQEDYKAWVILPAEWLGEHAVTREKIIAQSEAFQHVELLNAAIALAVVDDYGGIPGFEGADPEKWEPAKCPLRLLTWLTREVIEDFAEAYAVPKNS